MICPHCNKYLPEGLIMCFHCGEALEAPAEPVHIAEQHTIPEPKARQTGTICPHCGSSLPDGLTACFRCGKALRETAAPPHPIQKPVQPLRTGGKKKGLSGIVAAAVVVLLIGGAVGGHFMGLYTLPLLPERAETDETAPPSTTGTPGATQPGTSEMPVTTAMPGVNVTPDATTPEATNPGQPSDSDIGQPGGDVLYRFGYTDLSFTISTEYPPEFGGNTIPNAAAFLHYEFTVTGNTSDIAGIFHESTYYSWTDERIIDVAEMSIPAWKQSGSPLQAGREPKDGGILTIYNGYPPDGILELLFYVVNANWEPLGHVIIPVTIPAPNEPDVTEEPNGSALMPVQTIDGIVMGTYETDDSMGAPSKITLYDNHTFEFTINFGADMVGLTGSWDAPEFQITGRGKTVFLDVEDAVLWRDYGWMVEDRYAFIFYEEQPPILVMSSDDVGILPSGAVLTLIP